MRYRLTSQHYINDMLLEEGQEIGDGTGIEYRYSDGSAIPPSMQMTPLDDEAKAIFKARFGALWVDPDPVNRLPVAGAGPDKPPAPPAPPKPVVAPTAAPPLRKL